MLRSFCSGSKAHLYLVRSGQGRLVRKFCFLIPVLAPALCISSLPSGLLAQTRSATTTTLAVTSGGSSVTSVSYGSVVTLTASVAVGTSVVSTGQVNFCEAAASDCIGIHQIGMAQLTVEGTAVYRFKPGLGSHSYKAVFAGTNTAASSTSSAGSLTATGSLPLLATTTTLAESGGWGHYTLSATVTEIGSTAAPDGTISFVDTSNGNAVLGTATLGAATPGTNWLGSTLTTPGLSPAGVAVGDFNEDGVPDIAVTMARSNEVSIFLGKGDGTFTTTSSLGTGNAPDTVLAGDFNQDGHQDLAVANSNDSTISIFLGNGSGTFTSAPNLTSGGTPLKMVSGDFNGDGIPDLATANLNGGSVSILLGHGNGTFDAGATVTLGAGQAPSAIAAGDFNGDGKTDLAVAYSSVQTSILLGNGDGTFTVTSGPTTANTLGDLNSIAVSDFDGDGKLDLAVGNGNNVQGKTTPISIFLGNGDGTFAAVSSSPMVPSPVAIVIADLNQDGIPDLIVPNWIAGGATLLLGGGDGTFSAYPVTAPAGVSPEGLAVGDFNGDGIPDLAIANESGSTVSVDLTEPTVTANTPGVAVLPGVLGAHLVDASYPGDALYQPSVSATTRLWGQPAATVTVLAVTAAGSPVTTVPANTPVTLTATVMAGSSPLPLGQVNFCDATASSCSDIHLLGSAQLSNQGTAVFRFVPGSGTHQYKAVFLVNAEGIASASPAATLTVQAAATSPVATETSIAQSGSIGNYTLTATVTGIGGSIPMTGTVSFQDTSYSNVVLGTASLGSGTPGLAWVSSLSAPFADAGLIGFAAGDFNNDGIPDVAAGNTNGMNVSIFLGKGDGTFKTAAGPTLTTYTTGVVAGDFNGDGALDLAVSSLGGAGLPVPGYLTIFLGNGDGAFTAVSSAPTVGPYAQVFAAGDINGDGRLDLVVNDTSGTRILLGNGDGTFSQGPTTGLPATITVADLNGDAIPDLVVAGSNFATVYLGDGDGTFQSVGPALPVAIYLGPALVGDFNQDGIPDLALSGEYYSAVNIFLGKGDGTFTQVTGTSNPSISEPLAIAAGDFNHDGKPDLAISNYNASQGDAVSPDLTILLGNGDGTFTSGTEDTQFNGTGALIAADVNGDGVPDLVVDTGSLTVLLTKPTLTATATVTGVAPSGPAPHEVDAVYGGDSNDLGSSSAPAPLDVQTAAPAFSVAPGTYNSTQTVTITDATPGATIYYLLSGPNIPYGILAPYTGPLALSIGGGYTLQAYASETGYEESTTAMASYTINLPSAPAPTFHLAAGAYSSPQSLTITDTAPGVTIYYTTNGQYPSIKSSVYSSPIAITASATVTAIAIGSGYTNSSPTAAHYTISSTPAITWPTPAAISYGTPLGSAQLDATFSVPGTITYSPAAGTVLTAGTHVLTATFTPNDTVDFSTAKATVSLTVHRAVPQISWAAPAAILYGTALTNAQLDATSSVAGAFAYSPAAGAILPAGNQTLSATFTPADALDYNNATATVMLSVTNPAPRITSLAPAHVVAGGPAFSLSVNGAGFVAGSVVYWGGTALSTQYVSSTQLTAEVPASATATAGTDAVTVQTGSQGGGPSAAFQFEVDSASSSGAGSPSFNTPTATVNPGSSANYSVTLPSSVISTSVSCLNLPAGTSCSYANGTVTFATSASTPRGTYLITVVFTETLAGTAAGVSLPLLLLPVIRRRRKSQSGRTCAIAFAALILMAGALLLNGCGGGSMRSSPGAPSGITHQAITSGTVTLTIQ
jgi:Chitobiase/beta-hexosaminidase C-terminal domain/FG-GAP-like repeat/Bacterial Ig-like domain (group 3)/FG-GAP repeat